MIVILSQRRARALDFSAAGRSPRSKADIVRIAKIKATIPNGKKHTAVAATAHQRYVFGAVADSSSISVIPVINQ
jgi:hypothetical protein